MTLIVERVSGYSDLQMAEYCKLLYNVVSREGKPRDQEIVDKLQASIKHYSMKAKIQLRDYQTDIIDEGYGRLKKYRFVYLAMEVRTGKTLTSMGIADKLGVDHVLFVTKKKAIGSIENDYNMLMPSYQITVINYESLHTVSDKHRWGAVILDEAHGMGAFPKPSNRAVIVKSMISKYNPYVILLSGTPTPESYSQMYHQVYGIPTNPFSQYQNFYKFAADYVKVKTKMINGFTMNDYSNGKESIVDAMQPYTINYSQQEAGFTTQVTEEVLEVEIIPEVQALIKRLQRDLVIEGKSEIILADTPVKLMMKVHQLCSGTIKFESGNSMVLDTSKADFIKERFEGKKIGIFYKFKEELNALKIAFGDELTTELSVFEDTDKSIALQIVSGREGISLKKADFLVYYNIDFSATSYWQSKDRMTTRDRAYNHVYWVFSKGGIEMDIYNTVTKKKDYTVNHFKKNFYEK